MYHIRHFAKIPLPFFTLPCVKHIGTAWYNLPPAYTCVCQVHFPYCIGNPLRGNTLHLQGHVTLRWPLFKKWKISLRNEDLLFLIRGKIATHTKTKLPYIFLSIFVLWFAVERGEANMELIPSPYYLCVSYLIYRSVLRKTSSF